MKIFLSFLILLSINLPEFPGPDGCKKAPTFASKLGFNLKTVAYSTSDRKKTGIILIDMSSGKTYQNKSWKNAGSLGPVEIDENGNAYTIPIPVINILNNKPNEQNKIFRIDTNTGEMSEFLNIPHSKVKYDENPFGMLGLAYDCDTKIIYASTVANSTRELENGKIYAIDKEQRTIVDSIENIDVMGMEVSMLNNVRTLIVGGTRTSQVFSIKLGENGKFLEKPKPILSLNGLGPRGDDKTRKIRFMNDMILVYGIEFYYNLIAPTEKQETLYYFKWNKDSKEWMFDSYGN
jgi:hypothetical protein